MFTVAQERDKVIIDLGGRRRDLMLSCSEADKFERALRHFANVAECATPDLNRGEPWGARVESYDGMVAVRFSPPLTGNATRVPLPVEAARKLADLIAFKRQQAAYRMRFVFHQ